MQGRGRYSYQRGPSSSAFKLKKRGPQTPASHCNANVSPQPPTAPSSPPSRGQGLFQPQLPTASLGCSASALKHAATLPPSREVRFVPTGSCDPSNDVPASPVPLISWKCRIFQTGRQTPQRQSGPDQPAPCPRSPRGPHCKHSVLIRLHHSPACDLCAGP